MFMFLIGVILFFVNPTAGLVGLLAVGLHVSSYFFAYALTWVIEIALYLLYLAAGFAYLVFFGPKFDRKF